MSFEDIADAVAKRETKKALESDATREAMLRRVIETPISEFRRSIRTVVIVEGAGVVPRESIGEVTDLSRRRIIELLQAP